MKGVVVFGIILALLPAVYADWTVTKVHESQKGYRAFYFWITSYTITEDTLSVRAEGFLQLFRQESYPQYTFKLCVEYPGGASCVEEYILSIEYLGEHKYRITVQRGYPGKIGLTAPTTKIVTFGYSTDLSVDAPLKEGTYMLEASLIGPCLKPYHYVELQVKKTPPKPAVSVADIINSIIRKILELLKSILDLFR